MQNHSRKIRESKNMTLEQVADFLGVTKAQVSKMERGITRLNVDWIEKISKLFNCSVHDIIDDDYPRRILPNKNKVGQEFATAVVLGVIDCMQSGFIESMDLELQYSLRFMPPSVTDGGNMKLTAYNLKGSLFGDYSNGTQLIFADINEENKSMLKEGSVIICREKDNKGNECGYFVRAIEYDGYGIPYAVFKVKHGRNSFSQRAKTILNGNLGVGGLLEVYRDVDAGFSPKKIKKREIPLINKELDITAVLVKSIRDE